jgi:hypothetical protein
MLKPPGTVVEVVDKIKNLTPSERTTEYPKYMEKERRPLLIIIVILISRSGG